MFQFVDYNDNVVFLVKAWSTSYWAIVKYWKPIHDAALH